jgi:hypothetical protein
MHPLVVPNNMVGRRNFDHIMRNSERCIKGVKGIKGTMPFFEFILGHPRSEECP